MKKNYLFLILIAFISSCHKDKIDDLPTGKGVYIINEGNFNFGNGEVSFYDPNTNVVTNNLFQSANGYSLGDVAQSMFIKDSIAFVIVNNSSKIELVKLPSFQKIRTITINGSSPRYVLPVSDSIAYMTELYSNKIYVVNYLTGNLKTEISIPQYTEHLVQSGEYVFVEGKKIYSNPSAEGALYRIRVSDNTYIDKKEFAGDAEGIAVDSNKFVWILTSPDSASATTAAIRVFDKDFNLLFTYSFNQLDDHPSMLQIDRARGYVWYVLGKDIYKAGNGFFPGWPTIQTSATNIYSTGVDPVTGDVYVSDALDFIQQSRIYRYDTNGTLIHSFTAGIISGNFAFNHE